MSCSMLPVLLAAIATTSKTVLPTTAAFSIDVTMAAARADDARLREEIKKNPQVTQKVTPLMNTTGTPQVLVNTTIAVLSVLEVDDATQMVTSALYMELEWEDPLLAWDPSNYSDVSDVELPINTLWTPDVRVINTHEQTIIFDVAKTLTLYSSGQVVIHTPVVLKTACVMDLTNYPFDKQVCPVSFYSFNKDYLNVSANSDRSKSHIINSRIQLGNEWELIDVQIGEFMISENEPPFPNILLALRRKTTFYTLCLVVPIVLTSYLNTLVFLLPLQSGEKISFLISVFVSTSVFISYFTGVMPRGLDALPKLMKLVLGVIVQSLVVLLATIIVLRVHHHQERPNDQNRNAANDASRSADANFVSRQADEYTVKERSPSQKAPQKPASAKFK